jgi:hypothetical protein
MRRSRRTRRSDPRSAGRCAPARLRFAPMRRSRARRAHSKVGRCCGSESIGAMRSPTSEMRSAAGADRPAVTAEVGVVELVPGDGHRHGCARARAHAVGGDQSLVDRVLRVVEAGASGPSLLLPSATDEIADHARDRA